MNKRLLILTYEFIVLACLGSIGKLMVWNILLLDSVPRHLDMTVGGRLCQDWINNVQLLWNGRKKIENRVHTI